MSKFKVGDRVVIYTQDTNPNYQRRTGWVHTLPEAGYHLLTIRTDKPLGEAGGSFIFAHPKQCRKLVKKERRRVWIANPVDISVDVIVSKEPFNTKLENNQLMVQDHGSIYGWRAVRAVEEFIQVRRKK